MKKSPATKYANVDLSLILAFLVCTFLLFTTPRTVFADEHLDAVVDFIRPPGSHFAEQSHGRVLGAPDQLNVSVDVPESLIVAFIDNVVIDGPGDDLQVVEHIGGDSTVDIFGSADGITYEFLVQTNTDAFIDLADYSLETLRYLRIDGLSNGGAAPGYEVDAAVALNSKDVVFDCPTDFHLNAVTRFEQPGGSHDDGQPYSAIFGPPDTQTISIDFPEVLETAFSDIRVVDGAGPDLFIYEHINLDSVARISGSEDGVNFEFLIETDRSVAIDLADYSLTSLRFLRFEGVDNGGIAPGYDLDAAVAINFECIEILLGDVNLDGEVNLLDVAGFVELLTSGNYQVQADVNEDGTVNLLDVAPFVDILG